LFDLNLNFFLKGYIVAGIFKLLTGIIWVVVLTDKIGKASSYFVIILCSLTNGIWVLVDLIRILADGFKDGNGVSLKDWS